MVRRLGDGVPWCTGRAQHGRGGGAAGRPELRGFCITRYAGARTGTGRWSRRQLSGPTCAARFHGLSPGGAGRPRRAWGAPCSKITGHDVRARWHPLSRRNTPRSAVLARDCGPCGSASEDQLQTRSVRADAKTGGDVPRSVKLRPALWTFIDLPRGWRRPTTTAERALRPAVLWRRRSRHPPVPRAVGLPEDRLLSRRGRAQAARPETWSTT